MIPQEVKSVAPKLVPFFKAIAIYFVVFPSTPSIWNAILKIYPILSLMLFVVWHGMGNESKYAKRIFVGLLFCSMGDWCLLWPGYFELGMLAFATGHIQYILAFGFEPLNMKLGAVFYTLSCLALIQLMPGLNGILIPGVIIYTLILTTMMWRAVSRFQAFDNKFIWSTICACIGSILFVCSDLILGLNKFNSPIHNSQLMVMTTYYAAQFGIALSIVNNAKNGKRS